MEIICWQNIHSNSRTHVLFKDATRSSEVVEEENNWYGFMFVGDNIDKNVNPRFQRCENRGQSLHYFHGYALRDRVDLSTLSDVAPPFQ